MKTFEFEGKRYREALGTFLCEGCAFAAESVVTCRRVQSAAAHFLGESCCNREIIYILAEDSPKQSKIEKAKAALKAAMDALDELEVEE